eukprot:m.130414 g.130414  ORF g.130414 m.130414 type:complete len:534 (-) comp9448_c0_seq4:275-1876(-)
MAHALLYRVHAVYSRDLSVRHDRQWLSRGLGAALEWWPRQLWRVFNAAHPEKLPSERCPPGVQRAAVDGAGPADLRRHGHRWWLAGGVLVRHADANHDVPVEVHQGVVSAALRGDPRRFRQHIDLLSLGHLRGFVHRPCGCPARVLAARPQGVPPVFLPRGPAQRFGDLGFQSVGNGDPLSLPRAVGAVDRVLRRLLPVPVLPVVLDVRVENPLGVVHPDAADRRCWRPPAWCRFHSQLIAGEILRASLNTTYPGTYALIGAAAMLGGTVRMTISLSVILIEATNQVEYTMPLVLTLLLAKWVGDYFNESIYLIHIKINKVPLLEFAALDDMKRFLCSDIMSTPVKCLPPVVNVGDIVRLLESCTHNGFPIVESESETFCAPLYQGRFQGLILRSQIITMLQLHCWGTLVPDSTGRMTTTQKILLHEHFVRRYPQRRNINDIHTPAEKDSLYMDLTPYMHMHPYTLDPDMPLCRAFELYRTMGLRHIPILKDGTQIAGMLTRKELTFHRIRKLVETFDHIRDEVDYDIVDRHD